MKTYSVLAYAVDWCGYESHYEVAANSEEEALQTACNMLAEEYDLLEDGDGQYGEMEDFDEDGIAWEDAQLTSISAKIIED
jgi:hypothetical protein